MYNCKAQTKREIKEIAFGYKERHIMACASEFPGNVGIGSRDLGTCVLYSKSRRGLLEKFEQ